MNTQEFKLTRQLQLFEEEQKNILKKYERLKKRYQELEEIIKELRSDLQSVKNSPVPRSSLKSYTTLKKMSLNLSQEEKPTK